MARVILSMNKVMRRNAMSEAVANSALFVAVNAADGAEIEMAGRDDRILILVQNANTSAAKNVTIKAGDSFVASVDLVESVPAASTVGFVLDSGRFRQLSGEDRGKLIIMGESADIKISAWRLI